MKSRSVGILGLAAALAVAVSIYGFREAIEEIWLVHRLETGEAAVREQAAVRLAERRSARAVRPLVALFLAQPPAAVEQGDPYRRPPPASSIWENSLVAIGSRALPELIVRFRERTGSERARLLDLIERVGLELREAPVALEGLADPELETLHGVLADGLVKLGASLRGVERRVLLIARSESAATRQRAVALLRAMRGDAGADERLVELLVDLLDDPHEDVRTESAYTIGHFGATAASALSALGRLADDPEDAASPAANWAIKQLKGD